MAAIATRQKVRAQAKWVHTSARKARLVTDLIRGRSVPEARTILAFSTRSVARDVERVLRSAVANAESRPDLLWRGDDLVVSTAYADEGPTIKRHRGGPRPCRAKVTGVGSAAEGRGGDGAGRGAAGRRRAAHGRDGGVMGQKMHPGGLRVGVIHDWKSNWWTGKKEFPQYLAEDIRIRQHIYRKLAHAGL